MTQSRNGRDARDPASRSPRGSGTEDVARELAAPSRAASIGFPMTDLGNERHLGADDQPSPVARYHPPSRTLDVNVWVRCSDEGSLDLAGVPRGRHARVRRVERDLGVHLLAPRLAATTRRARSRASRADRAGTAVDRWTLGFASVVQDGKPPVYARRISHSTTATTPMRARIVMTIPMVVPSFVPSSAAGRGSTL